MATGRVVAETWLNQQLSPLVAVYRQPAPEEAAYPFIAVGLISAVDVRAMGDPARVERLTYDVSCWDKGLSSTAVNNLAEQVLNALDGVPPASVAGGTVLSCRRIGAIPVATTIEDGETYQRDGGLYLIEVLS